MTHTETGLLQGGRKGAAGGHEQLSWTQASPGRGERDSLLRCRAGKGSINDTGLKAQQLRSRCELVYTWRSSHAPNFYYYCPSSLVTVIPPFQL